MQIASCTCCVPNYLLNAFLPKPAEAFDALAVGFEDWVLLLFLSTIITTLQKITVNNLLE